MSDLVRPRPALVDMRCSLAPASLAPAFLALVLSSCGSEAEIASARRYLNAGRLDRAEQALEGVTGPDAVALKTEIAARRDRRAFLDEALTRLMAADDDPLPALRELLEGEEDPVARESIERALSQAVDRPRKKKRRDAPRDETALLLAEARRSVEAGEWGRAQTLLNGATKPDDPRVERLLRDLPALAESDAARLLEKADSLAQSVGTSIAADFLDRAAERFPEGDSRQRLERHAERFASRGDEEEEEKVAYLELVEDTDVGTDAPTAEPVELELEKETKAAPTPSFELAATALAKAAGDERDRLYDQLAREAVSRRSAASALANALEERWRSATKTLARSAITRKLADVAEVRAELDEARRLALELIFDEERYFYPYFASEVGQERAREYLIVQDEVDARVARVRTLWGADERVTLSSSYRKAALEIEWIMTRDEKGGAKLDVPDGAPPWILGVDGRCEAVDVRTFAWSFEEAASRRVAVAVRPFNESQWEGLPEDEAPITDERDSVRFTNEYRLMFGVRPLGWNPRIYAAARSHSEYMARTGDFGHSEPDPARRTPRDRMSAFGYPNGTGENVHLGRISARGVHDAWIRSSAHHRALLLGSNHEVASAVVGDSWTQNFGTDTAFLNELEEWRD